MPFKGVEKTEEIHVNHLPSEERTIVSHDIIMRIKYPVFTCVWKINASKQGWNTKEKDMSSLPDFWLIAQSQNNKQKRHWQILLRGKA